MLMTYILSASNNDQYYNEFVDGLQARLEAKVGPQADWLQTRIQQDKDLNVTLDQGCNTKSMIQQFLPNIAPQEPTKRDLHLMLV